jgi:hypothetical protein
VSAPTRSLAGHVLATRSATTEEAMRLAAYALGDQPSPTVKTKADLERTLRTIDGREGQTERAAAIRAKIAEMDS